MIGFVSIYKSYSFKNGLLNISQQDTSKSKDKQSSKPNGKKKKKASGKTRTYTPPKKDK